MQRSKIMNGINIEMVHYLDYPLGKARKEGYDFKKRYNEYLKNPQKSCPNPKKNSGCKVDEKCPENCVKNNLIYFDIDGKNNNKNDNGFRPLLSPLFYDHLVIFLKKKGGENCFSITENVIKFKNNDNEGSESKMFLISDQFCFSAPAHKKGSFKLTGWNTKKYPYARYLYMKENNIGKEINEAHIELVANVIYETRILGCSFIWPILENENRSSEYNKNRGVKSYIEDRVDLTLQEIKMFYKFLKENNSDVENICNSMKEEGYILLSGNDYKEIYKWLSAFKNFKNYVEFFCFQDFVEVNEKGECYVLDIIKSKLNKIAARWPAKAVAQFFLTFIKKQ